MEPLADAPTRLAGGGVDPALAARLAEVTARIEAARERRGSGEPVTLVAASKGVSAARVREACILGVGHLGESYLQEAVHKMPWLAGVVVQWHLIGHLQANKALRALGSFDQIQSVDSLRLAGMLSEGATTAGMVQPVLVQVNLGSEPQKHGFTLAETPEACRQLGRLPGLSLRGMMALGPLASAEDSRPRFQAARVTFDLVRAELGPGFAELSMGMSGDFEVAIESGSTMVRVGTALFGPR
ncbi:MAG: YggS family pyridoxal phosphate-dependent enzyme [Candidatus Dormibacteria bacterium]